MPYQNVYLDFSAGPSAGNGPGDAPRFSCTFARTTEELFEEKGIGSTWPWDIPREISGERDDRLEPGRARPLPPRSAGDALWQSLPPPVWDALLSPPREGDAIRVLISSRFAVINDLPWELLAPPGEKPLTLRSSHVIVRNVPTRVSIPPRLVRRPRALLVAAQPLVKGRFEEGAELFAQEAALAESGFETSTLPGATMDSLQHALLDFQPQILHFLGHSAMSRNEGYLVLETDGELADWVSEERLAKLLPPSVGLIGLSSPTSIPNYQIQGFSRIAQTRSQTLPSMIVSQYQPSLGDRPGRFWTAFYRHFRPDASEPGAIEGDLTRALGLARREIEEEGGPPQWLAFALCIRDGTGVPFRFARGGVAEIDPRRQAMEIEAMFRARDANDIADQIQKYGDIAPTFLREEFREERDRANQASSRLKPDRE